MITDLRRACQDRTRLETSASHCSNPERCASRVAHYRSAQQKASLRNIIRLHETFLLHDPRSITASEHAITRMAERGFSFKDVLGVVECCVPFEWHDVTNAITALRAEWGEDNKLLAPMMGKGKIYTISLNGEADDGRPLHVCCRMSQQPASGVCWQLHILTAYDPSREAYRWSHDYTVRTCFCQKDSKKAGGWLSTYGNSLVNPRRKSKVY